MKPYLLKLSSCLGLPLVYLGVILQVVFFASGLTSNHILLFLPVVLVLVGTVSFIYKEKNKGNY